MSQLRNPKYMVMKRAAWFFIFLMIQQIIFPTAVLALTSGPSQPEVQSFQPVGTTEMVNVFTGDFSYNIPLFEVPGPDGGYPINLFYNSVTDMNQEASWTGLGWNINVGSLSRNMRGLPDDFDGEQVTRKLDMLDNETIVAGVSGGLEIGGYDAAKDVFKTLGLSLSLGTNYIYNTHRGAGFSIDPTLGIGGSFGNGKNGTFSPNLSLGLNLSSTSMASLNANVSMGYSTTKSTNRFNLGLSFNGREGLSNLSLGYTLNSKECLAEDKIGKNGNIISQKAIIGGVSASYSFAKTAYTPEVKLPWTGWNLSGSFSFAPGAAIVYGSFGFKGSYSVQRIQNAGLTIPNKAYGYNYLQNALDDNHSLMDFNREKDGPVHQHNRFLATPNLSYDVYSVVGQGIGGMYRAHRSDYGFVYDPELFSSTGGFSAGAQIGPTLKLGADVQVNYSEERNDRWPKGDHFGNKNTDYSFKTAGLGANFESVYYKTAGEMASEPLDAYDYMGGDQPLRLKKGEGSNQFGIDPINGGTLEAKQVVENGAGGLDYLHQDKITFNTGKSHRAARRGRNMAIQNISNNDLINSQGEEALPEYDVKYYDYTQTGNLITASNYANAPTTDVTRKANEQNAGFTAMGINGVRWVYGLPVQNKTQKEATFSVDPVAVDPNLSINPCQKRVAIPQDANGIDYTRSGTHNYIDEKTIPEYAHSYMLTSVLGSDYVDVDGIPGPSEGDVGYWMKTNYVKLSNNYQWRAPFFGANFIQGTKNSAVDDMGAFMWGEREVYLPATIETKTHVAYFEISKREDNRGAGNYIQNTNDPLGDYSYRLDKIKLYSKKEIQNKGLNNAKPLKVVHFEYDYSLCPGVENNGNTSGKLTLKKVWFTQEDSKRGALSPYVFNYNAWNRSYDENNIDRWGIYKEAAQSCSNLDNPYTNQDPSLKSDLDRDVAAWHLEEIILPSGATMKLVLERDDYAYVQDAVATQMQPIYALGVDGAGVPNPTVELSNQPYAPGANGTLTETERRVYFKLESPLLPTETQQLKKYIEDLPLVTRSDQPGKEFKQVYYKIRSRMKEASILAYEYVTGYAELAQDANGNDLIGFDSNSPKTNGKYTEAYIVLMPSRKQVKGKRYHPLLMTNWDFLKNNIPDKMFGSSTQGQQQINPQNAIPQIAGLGAGFSAIFTGYYQYARDNNFGRTVDESRSFIKLNTPDKIKYGGGLRVKQITIDDKWTPENNLTNTLGVTYDYTMTGKDGQVHSSGVMENEAIVGYDACALKYADVTEEIQGGVVRDVHIYEYPINEGLYPGSGVGYSQVTVRSLASDLALQAAKATDRAQFLAQQGLPDGFGTTGQTVHEFYTAKDFPIITDKTDLDDAQTQPWLSMVMSFMMLTRFDQYTGTQGYSIELNNMHGQTKATKTYAQDTDGNIVQRPVTEISYNYKTKQRYIKDRGKVKLVQVLNNEVNVLIDDHPNAVGASDLDAHLATRLVGVDYDFVLDGRSSRSASTSGGTAINIDLAGTFPLPFPWPQFQHTTKATRLAVTNKIIQRRGILTEQHVFDGQSHLITYNKVFDQYTGQPLLTYTDNQLGGGIYNYTVPAYLAHSTMGMAAANIGMKFTAEMVRINANTNEFDIQNTTPSNIIYEGLVPGDEYLISGAGKSYKTRAVYLGGSRFSSDGLHQTTNGTVVTFHNIRSGNRNLLVAPIAQYSTVKHAGAADDAANPMKGRVAQNCTPEFVNFRAQAASSASTPLEKNVLVLNYLLQPGIKNQWINSGSATNSYSLGALGLDCDYCVFWDQSLIGNESGVKTISQCETPVHRHFFSPPQDYEGSSTGVVIEDLQQVEILGPDPSLTSNSIVRFHMIDATGTSRQVDLSLKNVDQLYMHTMTCVNLLTDLFVERQTNTQTQVDYKTINQVLSASATAYSEAWNVEHYDYCGTKNSWSNPYTRGEKGVWRTKSTYAYVDDRNFETYNPNGGNTPNVDIQQSGLVDNVPLFNWSSPFFEYCVKNWVRTEEVTKYNLSGTAVEARDILGNHQAEIYGYKDNVVTAKGVNTRYYEMGFQGFEEWDMPRNNGLSFVANHNNNYNSGNLDFLPPNDNCSVQTVTRQENYRLCYPLERSSGGFNESYFLVNKVYDPFDDSQIATIKLNLTNGSSSHDFLISSAQIQGFPVNINAGEHFQIPGLAPALDETTADQFTIYKVGFSTPTSMNGWWAGDATLIYHQNLSTGFDASTITDASIATDEAHTGRHSLRLYMSSNKTLRFPQQTLRLQSNKTYVFSAWIKDKNLVNTSPTYDNGTLEIKMGGVLMQPKGAMIEGWQRVEGQFTYKGDQDLTFKNLGNIRNLYVDDIRIYPADANMQSYVYDPVNYRLKAVLDNNNYASFYVYDDDGSLIIVRKETERGIKTIQESRNYVQPNGYGTR